MHSGAFHLARTILLILFGLLAFAVHPALADELLFMDDFKDGTADNWQVIDFGEFEVVDEMFCFQTI